LRGEPAPNAEFSSAPKANGSIWAKLHPILDKAQGIEDVALADSVGAQKDREITGLEAQASQALVVLDGKNS
jgi:hypothetical protein